MRIMQVVGYKNAGKTTLTCELVRELNVQGYRVGTLKHDAHDFEPDVPGTDTWQHRQAGAQITAITSRARTAWVQEQSTPLDQLIAQMGEHALDYLIIEGFKSAIYPKLALIRSEEDIDLLSLPNVIAAVLREPAPMIIEAAVIARHIPLFIQPSKQLSSSLLSFIRGLSQWDN